MKGHLESDIILPPAGLQFSNMKPNFIRVTASHGANSTWIPHYDPSYLA